MANKYNNILSLEEAKRYLRLEDDFIDDDSDIERMIESSLDYISKHTQYIFSPRDKTYYSGNLCYISVFDFPINTTEFGEKHPLYYSGFVKFVTDEITLNVGFSDKTSDDFPTGLIDSALQMIKVFYYEAEKNINTTLLPMSVNEIINANRRFMAV